MKKNNAMILIIASFMSILCLTMFIPTAFSVPLFAPVMITFDSSVQVQKSTDTVLNLYPKAQVIAYKDIHSLGAALTLMRSHSQIILIGHGSAKGILSVTQGIISWQKIAKWVNNLPSTNVYFLSCDSISATKLVNKPSYGFAGAIDGPLAAFAIAIVDGVYYHENVLHDYKLFLGRISSLNTGAKFEAMSITGGTQSTFYWDGKLMVSGYPALYPHDDRATYNIYPTQNWNSAGNQLLHYQIGSTNVNQFINVGTLIATIIGLSIAFYAFPEGESDTGSNGNSLIQDIVGALVGGLLGLLFGSASATSFEDESGAIWFWIDLNFVNLLKTYIGTIWTYFLIVEPVFQSLLSTYIALDLATGSHYIRVGSTTYLNHLGISDP